MRQQLEMSERASLFADPPQDVVGCRMATIRLHNIGRAPTGPFMVWVSIFRLSEGKPIQTKERSETFRPDKRRVPLGGYVDFLVPICESSRADMDAIRTGQQSLHVNVDIRYEDGFGSTQVSTSYFTYAGPWDGARICLYTGLTAKKRNCPQRKYTPEVNSSACPATGEHSGSGIGMSSILLPLLLSVGPTPLKNPLPNALPAMPCTWT
jgi:hypothetical protein